MSSAAIVWIIIALFGLFFVVFAWKKGRVKEPDSKAILYLGIIFTVVGLIGKVRYNEWGFLPMGLLLLVAGWFKKIKGKKA